MLHKWANKFTGCYGYVIDKRVIFQECPQKVNNFRYFFWAACLDYIRWSLFHEYVLDATQFKPQRTMTDSSNDTTQK